MGTLDCELRFATVGDAKLTERLIEEFLRKGPTVVAAGDAARIDAMLRDELVKVGDEEGGWTTLYRHKTTGTFWELTYPKSQMHGGGPRQLVELSAVMRVLEPDLIADVTFYATEAGGKTAPVFPALAALARCRKQSRGPAGMQGSCLKENLSVPASSVG